MSLWHSVSCFLQSTAGSPFSLRHQAFHYIGVRGLLPLFKKTGLDSSKFIRHDALSQFVIIRSSHVLAAALSVILTTGLCCTHQSGAHCVWRAQKLTNLRKVKMKTAIIVPLESHKAVSAINLNSVGELTISAWCDKRSILHCYAKYFMTE